MNNLKEIIAYLLLNNQCFIKYNKKVIEIYCIPPENMGNFNYFYDSSKSMILRRLIDPIKLLSKSKLMFERWRIPRRTLYLTTDDLNNLRNYAKS